VAVIEVELPEHIVTPAPADIVGSAFTDTILVAVFEQPLASVPVTV
jgi:hypothetical protein